MGSARVRARPAHQDPTQPFGVRCPRCLAAPGYVCRGKDTVRMWHRERVALAQANARETGASR